MDLLEGGHDADNKDTFEWTPLSWAARYGHEAVVELLLTKGRVDPDPRDSTADATFVCGREMARASRQVVT